MSEGAERELRQSSSWARVRSGLGWLIWVWVALTLVGVLVQMFTADVAMRAQAGEEAAQRTLALTSLAHQLFYSLCAVFLVVAALGITQAPPKTRAIPPALAAAAAFLLVFVLNIVVGLAERTPVEVRTTSAETVRTYWTILAVLRGCGVVALLLAVFRVCAALGEARTPAVTSIALGFAALDGGYPVYRFLARSSSSLSETSPWLHRGLVLGLQLVVAYFMIDSALRARRSLLARTERELEKKKKRKKKIETKAKEEPPPEPVDEPEEMEDEPASEPAVAKPQSRTEQIVGAAALALGTCLVPVWDARAAGTFGSTAILFVLGAGVAAYALTQMLARSPYAARGVYGLAACLALGYIGFTAWDTALARSRRVNEYAVCETMVGPQGEIVMPSGGPESPRFEGARLPNGQPCTSIIEDRGRYREEYPEGNFRDGMIQISRHFPDDRARFFTWPVMSLVLLVVSGVIVARAARLPRRNT
jgi:hypothetical protein